MKIRQCWVSNSSSSSFVGTGWKIDNNTLNLICENIPEMHWFKNAAEDFEDSATYDGLSLKRLYLGGYIIAIENLDKSKELVNKLNNLLGCHRQLNAVIWGDD